jgi:hypothetical protein
MSSSVRAWVSIDWTASQSDLAWPWSYLLAGLVAATGPAFFYTAQYAKVGGYVPLEQSLAMTLGFVVLVPLLGLREKTEVLFDAVNVAIRVFVGGFVLYAIAFWTTPGREAFSNTPTMIAVTVAMVGLYGIVVLGLLWVIQFARKGTSGVTEPQ